LLLFAIAASAKRAVFSGPDMMITSMPLVKPQENSYADICAPKKKKAYAKNLQIENSVIHC